MDNVIDPDFLILLACPACESHPPVTAEEDRLVCNTCKRVYSIRDGIPAMLVEESLSKSKE